jgi:hypothetical protein
LCDAPEGPLGQMTPDPFFPFGEKGSNLRCLVQSQAAYQLADPRMPCGCRRALLYSLLSTFWSIVAQKVESRK